MDRRELKRWAKGVVRQHYVLLVAMCLIVALLSVEYTDSLRLLRAGTHTARGGIATVAVSEDVDLYTALLESYQDLYPEQVAELEGFMGSALGRSRGVLATIVNGVASGKFSSTVIVGLRSITDSENAAATIFIIGSMLLSFLMWMFIKRNFLVTLRRMALESQNYPKTSFGRICFLFQNGRWLHTAKTMLLTAVLHLLWSLTLVGLVVKYFSYFLVPYIAAENPTADPWETITLSRRMMRGHKWQCFCWSLTFLGWDLLSIGTLGLSDLLFTAPYKTAFWAAYYAALRKEAKEKGIEGAELLNDTYLFESAPQPLLDKTYADIVQLKTTLADDPISQDRGFRHFLAQTFGISLYSAEAEAEYDEQMVLRQRIATYEDIVAGKAYPARLHPQPAKEREKRVWAHNYLRHYSPLSLVLIYFIISFAGWLWEVAIGYVQGGVLVNRGVLHGPWLPIYGTGSILILLLLNRFRKKPVLEFWLAMVLSGTVEYCTAWYLELVSGGQKWWDYTGYFLNLHGRICAEGLLAFGVGGAMVVYYLAPALDHALRKLKPQTATALCVLLLVGNVADNVYSLTHPHTGPGITSPTAAAPSAPVLVKSAHPREKFPDVDCTTCEKYHLPIDSGAGKGL